MRESANNRSGGGYINELSLLKARAIKKPLKYYTLHNSCVNRCNSIRELSLYLKYHDKEAFEKLFNTNK